MGVKKIRGPDMAVSINWSPFCAGVLVIRALPYCFGVYIRAPIL